jgi:hypothetical protein
VKILELSKLLLPALFPSWRFFDVIGPSPRIELCLIDTPDDEPVDWRACRPRPARLGPWEMVTALFWNPRWNETLFLANCSERIIQGQVEHCCQEIRQRLLNDLSRDRTLEALPRFFRFRLVFVSRDGDGSRRDVGFISPPYPTVTPIDS